MKFKNLILIMILSATAQADSELSIDRSQVISEIQMNTRYIYNVFYDDKRALSDGAVTAKPFLKGQSKPSSLYVTGELSGEYEKYIANPIQDHFDFKGLGKLLINEGGRQSFEVEGSYRSFSDLSPTERYGRTPRSTIDGLASGRIKTDRGHFFDIKGHALMEDFNNTNLNTVNVNPNYLSRRTYEGMFQYSNPFLPETAWFLRGSGGITQYPNKINEDDITSALISAKSDSSYAFVEGGFVGRLTDKSTVDCASGYLMRLYEKSASFAAPVFYLRFTEQVTRRDQLLAGYNYVVKDSYWSNYLLEQEIYLGLARFMGEQFLILTRVGYSYLSYSLPMRRDDERIAGSLTIKYSLSPTIKLTAEAKVDLLSSDAYDNSNVPTNPDRPATYKAGSFGLGIVASY